MYRVCVLVVFFALASGQTSDNDILQITNDVWNAAEAAGSFFSDAECQYDINASPSTGPFYTYVDEGRLTSGTYGAFTDLLDNYITETGDADQCGAACEAERNDFLDLILATEAMDLTRLFLGERNDSILDPVFWKQYIYNIWFSPYSRTSGPMDSSGFEHVFLGEIDDNSAKGYHNWIKAYWDEQPGGDEFIYHGADGFCEPDTPKFSMDFCVDGRCYNKAVTSMMIQVPPEVEIAFFTICKFTRGGQYCRVTVESGQEQDIQTYTNDCDAEPGFGCVASAYFVC